MNKCYKCSIRIVKHLWVDDNKVYCSPLCIRGKDSRYSDKVVKKIGCAGLKKDK